MTSQSQTHIDLADLTEAFPSGHQSEARAASKAVLKSLHSLQWTDRFSVLVNGETVFLPARLHFVAENLSLNPALPAWKFARSLQTRSKDGFQRQRALQDIFPELQPWAAPFIIALIGEYVVEILIDIERAMTPEASRVLANFILENPTYWETTKRRVMSYWSVYYRREFTRENYVGFHLVDRLEAELVNKAP